MTVVDAKTYWVEIFDNAEARELTIRVGPWRATPYYEGTGFQRSKSKDEKWLAMRDWAEGPYGLEFASLQKAVNFMVNRLVAEIPSEYQS